MLQIEKLLPGYNCGECGLASCREFAAKLVDVAGLDRCTILKQERFKGRSEQIAKLLACSEKTEDIIGVLDGLRADFALAPLPRRALLPGGSASLQSRGAAQRGRHLPLPAFGLSHHSFCQSAQERPGNCHCASGGAGAPAAGAARA